MADEAQVELATMKVIYTKLSELGPQAQTRILEWVMKRLAADRGKHYPEPVNGVVISRTMTQANPGRGY